jgi:adenylate kinase family enzyme
MDSTLPVVEHYEQLDRVARINADRSPEEVYKETRRYFLEF